MALPAMLGGAVSTAAVRDLFASHSGLLAVRLLLGPIATIILVWMCWQTLKIPQTMAATGLLYIAVGTGLYLAGTYAYQHFAWFRNDFANPVGHVAADGAKDVYHYGVVDVAHFFGL